MKLAKMSLIAALALTTSVYAIDNVKVNGDVKLYYGTYDTDAKNAPDMFDKDVSYGDAALHLGLTADLTTGVSAGVSVTAVSTLGLENNLVSQTWSNSHGVTGKKGANFVGNGINGHQLDDAMWVDEAWIAGTAFDTTAKVGRQQLDTPLAFTETWGIDTNTFEAAVLINQSIPDTTLVATYIGKSNGAADDTSLNTTINSLGAAQAGYVAQDGKFNTFGSNGVYAAGVINNSFKPLTVQAWYYDMQNLAKAYWLQADLNVGGFLAGVQYANTDVDSLAALTAYAFGTGLTGPTTTTVDDTTMYSVMLGYEMKDVVTVKAAYSSVDDDGTLGMANTATGSAATIGGQSKMYTEMWWNYGAVSAVGADSYSLTVEATPFWDVDLLLGYYFADVDPKNNTNVLNFSDEVEVTEVAFTASKKFGPLDASIALIWDDFSDETNYTFAQVTTPGFRNDDETVTTLQVYLTYNF